jgi:Family of unknown function (DUF6152)
MRTKLAVAVAIIGLMAAAAPVLAHHAFAAEFDSNKPVTLRGTVTKMDWVNPHSWLYIDVKGSDGRTVNWAIECGPPNSLLRAGWNKTSLTAGTEVIVEGFHAKNGTPVANGRNVALPDGKKLFVGSSGPGAPPER